MYAKQTQAQSGPHFFNIKVFSMANSTNPDKKWSFFRRARYLIIFYGIPWFIHNFFRFVVNNGKVGNTYSEGEGVIFCSNHQSHLDALTVGAGVATPYGTRKFVAFMGNGQWPPFVYA